MSKSLPKDICVCLIFLLLVGFGGRVYAACTVSPPGNQGVTGCLQIQSGTGAFSSVSAANKTLTVAPSVTLKGTVSLYADDEGCSGCIIPLIYTPSWGMGAAAWRLINSWIPDGTSSQQASISLTVPSRPGRYNLIFAFQWEKTPDNVASGTNWARDFDVWGDGNDIGSFTKTQISEAQSKGWTQDQWLFVSGYENLYVPADAITLIVK